MVKEIALYCLIYLGTLYFTLRWTRQFLNGQKPNVLEIPIKNWLEEFDNKRQAVKKMNSVS